MIIVWKGLPFGCEFTTRTPQFGEIVELGRLRKIQGTSFLILDNFHSSFVTPSDPWADSDLHLPPSNRFEALKGERKGQYSIRINDRWRICFEWRNGNAEQVEIVDYH